MNCRSVWSWKVGASLLAGLGIAACVTPPGNKPGDDEGQVLIALMQVPPDVQCLRIRATGSRTEARLLPVTAGQATTFNLNGLPLGSVAFLGEAFAPACPSVAAATIPDWISDPVAAVLNGGQVAIVNLTMRRNGRAMVGVDFVNDDGGTDGGDGGSDADAGPSCSGPELCNGLDDDCNPATPDGSQDPLVGQPCDGPDSDLCMEGIRSCAGGALVCSDNTGSTFDICNGLDDDCDPASPDGSEDPLVGQACDGADTDLCPEGIRSCAGGALFCSDNTGSTLDICNGLDDDCDPASPDGSEDPLVGQACDGADTDLCPEGIRSCAGGALFCSDNTGSTLDICNGLDDDCDPASPDGSEDPLVGQACDGADTDLCPEGIRACAGGALFCTDNTGSNLDICNGLNDDCDPSSPDGSEDPLVGQPCDGPDSDLCLEGIRSCAGGALFCSDSTGSTLDICNGFDDDCDPSSPDGSEDPPGSPACM